MDSRSRSGKRAVRFARLAAAFALVCPALLPPALSGCGLLKKGNATSPVTLSKAPSSALGVSSNITRLSGEVILLQLNHLFPSAAVVAGQDLDPAQFDTLTASGTNQIVADMGRYTSALAQNVMRQKAAKLCQAYANLTPANAWIFNTPGALFNEAAATQSGETLPADPAVKAALVAARNAWLIPLAAASPEVTALASVYTAVRAASTGTATVKDGEALRSVCEAALISPQFLMGGPYGSDPLRKVALEIGRTAPTIDELSAFAAGTLSIRDYVKNLQATPGYLKAVQYWHADWLGLRPLEGYVNYLNTQILPTILPRDQDPRYGANAPASEIYPTMTTSAIVTPASGSPQTVLRLKDENGGGGEYGGFEAVDASKLQAFDPRTALVVWEAQDASNAGGAWDVLGGFVLNDASHVYLSQYAALLSAYNPGNAISASILAGNYATAGCKPVPNRFAALYGDPSGYADFAGNPHRGLSTFGALTSLSVPGVFLGNLSSTQLADWGNATDAANLSYYECPGYARLTAGGFRQVSMSDLYIGLCQNETAGAGSIRVCHPGATYAEGNLAGTVTEYYNKPTLSGANATRRMRRFAPAAAGANAVAQDGISQIQLHYSEAPIYVPNTLTRFFAACVARWPLRVVPPTYLNNAGIRADDGFPPAQAFNHNYGWEWAAYPDVINSFRCGKPDYSQLPTGGMGFGRAWNVSATVVRASVNTNSYSHYYNKPWAGIVNYMGFVGTDGASATTALNEDLVYPRAGVSLASVAGYVASTIGALNSVAYNVIFFPPAAADGSLAITSGPGSGGYAETQSTRRLVDDLNGEAVNLINHVISARKPYSELFTAKYTFGHSELELYYRTQGYVLARDAGRILSGNAEDGYAADVAGAPLHLIDFSGFRTINGNVLRTAHGYQVSSSGIIDAGRIDPRPAAGILTMPSFLGPVNGTGKMRTIASRVFKRLLCSDPSAIPLSPDQRAAHAAYMVSATQNAAAKAHLNNPSCVSCHIHLDPLGAGLSPFFLNTVDTPAVPQGMVGDLLWANVGAPLGVQNGMLSAKAGGPVQARGAFLGQGFSGWEELAQLLVRSEPFAQCVVRQTAEHIIGRTLSVGDSPTFNKLVKSFGGGMDYDKLVQDIADSPLLQGGR